MKRLLLAIILVIGLIISGIPVHAQDNEEAAVVAPPCPDCSGPEITNVVFSSGMICECVNADYLEIGTDVTIESGASVTFKTPQLFISNEIYLGNGVKVQLVKLGSIALTADPTEIDTGPSSFSTLTAILKDASGQPVPQGTEAVFQTDYGQFPNNTKTWTDQTYDGSGTVVAYLYAGDATNEATITATSGGVSARIKVQIHQASASLELIAKPIELPADGSTPSKLTATVKDQSGEPLDGVTVNFAITSGSGTLSGSSVTTEDGIATVTLTAITGGEVKVSATVGQNALSAEVTVTFVSDVPASIELVAVPSELLGNGVDKSEIRATVKDESGSPVPDGVVINFAIISGPGVLSANSATTVSGVAKVDLTSGTSGSVVVKATATQGQASAEVTVTFTRAPGSLSLTTSQTVVKSDNSDEAAITATVLDINYVPYPGATVNFSVLDGQLSASSVETDENGEAKVRFSSGTAYKANREVIITAKVSGIDEKTIPIQIIGTTIGLATGNSNLELGPGVSDTATLTITVKDAGASPVYDAAVTLGVDPSSTGDAHLSQTSGKTDVIGQLVVKVQGTAEGKVIVKVHCLGVTVTQTYTVATPGDSFGITAPSEDPYNLKKGEAVTVVVKAPTQNKVMFATTLGSWDGGTESVVTKSVINKETSAVLKGDNAGTATVQVYDEANTDATDSIKINIFLPVDAAAQIALQASSNVVAPSTEALSNSVTLQARVRDENDQIVPNVPVSFRIVNSTGGGEYIAPPLSYTKMENGIAEAIFTSGSMSSSSNGIELEASVVGNAGLSHSTRIVIGGTAGSVVIGQSTTIESINNDTSYKLPMSAQVVDSNGNPVPGAAISLQLWPKNYRTGIWIPQDIIDQSDCIPGDIGTWPNEDDRYPGTVYYRNLILDEGEDVNEDGQLTPPSSAVGSVPAQVVADDTGVANFYLTFPKSSAAWIKAELTGSTLVLGSETRSTSGFVLPWSIEDAKKCVLNNSPYNTSAPLMEIDRLTATPDQVVPDGSSTSLIRASVTQNGLPVADGTPVSFVITSGTGAFVGPFPSGLIETTTITTAGQASVVYYAGDIPGIVTIKAQLPDGTNRDVNLTLLEVIGSMTLGAVPGNIPADGSSSSAITATVKDTADQPVPAGTPVTFTTNTGTFQNGSNQIILNTPNEDGTVTASLKSNTSGVAFVTASAPIGTYTVTQSVNVTFN